MGGSQKSTALLPPPASFQDICLLLGLSLFLQEVATPGKSTKVAQAAGRAVDRARARGLTLSSGAPGSVPLSK